MNPSSDTSVDRFTTGERWIHRSLSTLVLVLIGTGALLFIPDLGSLVGNRQIVRVVHEVSGWLIPVVLVLMLLSKALRADASRLNRFRPSDWEWLRSSDRRSGRIRVGKFNAGQKLNAAWTLGSLLVLLGTGAIMFFSSAFPDFIRTGATFVHDWLSLAVVVVVIGHVWMAYNDASARAGMRTGSVPLSWAEREHADWADEVRPR